MPIVPNRSYFIFSNATLLQVGSPIIKIVKSKALRLSEHNALSQAELCARMRVIQPSPELVYFIWLLARVKLIRSKQK